MIKNMNKKQEVTLEVGQRYKIDGRNYIIDEKTFRKIYGYLIDTEGNPYGRRRIIGTKDKEVIKL